MSARVTIIGTVGKEPESKLSGKGNAYVQFSIATWTGKKGEDRWWKVMAFGPIADRALELVRRGSYVEVEGKFDYSEREYQGKRYQDFTCFCERITEKEKPAGKVHTPEQPPEIEKPMTGWGKAHDESVSNNSPRDPFDRENHYTSGRDSGYDSQSGTIDFNKIPF